MVTRLREEIPHCLRFKREEIFGYLSIGSYFFLPLFLFFFSPSKRIQRTLREYSPSVKWTSSALTRAFVCKCANDIDSPPRLKGLTREKNDIRRPEGSVLHSDGPMERFRGEKFRKSGA